MICKHKLSPSHSSQYISEVGIFSFTEVGKSSILVLLLQIKQIVVSGGIITKNISMYRYL